MQEPTEHTRVELMQMASRGAPFMWVNRCTQCSGLTSLGLDGLPEGEHLIMVAMRNVGPFGCRICHPEDDGTKGSH